MKPHFKLTAEALEESAIVRTLAADGVGGIVTFVGRVRDAARGRRVLRLLYEAYAEMAEPIFNQIAREAEEQFEIIDVAIYHRVGMLEVGEISVVIAVCAAHRGPAFEACRHIIDRLKQIAPIWKKEFSPDGAVWIDDRP